MIYLISMCSKQKRRLKSKCVNMITGINESKKLIKHLSCECKSKLDGRKCNSNQWWNKDKCWCECKKHIVCEKDYVWNPAKCKCENGKYLAIIMNEIICDGIIESHDKKQILIKRKQSVKQRIYIF